VEVKLKFLVSSDWHLRDDRPRCRVDVWHEAQQAMLSTIVDLINAEKCPMFVAGDILDSGTISPSLENMIIRELKRAEYPIYTIAGNHDMPYHNMKHLYRSSYMVLVQAGVLTHLQGIVDTEIGKVHAFQFGEPVIDGEGICMCHQLVFPHTPPEYLIAISAEELLKSLNYGIILSGDNHMSFYKKYGDKILINGGGILRQDADKKNTFPKIFLYHNGVSAIDLLEDIEFVQQDYLLEQKNRDIRISTFIERIKVTQNIGLNFKQNIDNHIHDVRDEVVEIIYKAIKGELND
jgi:predicted phosphodiesterase